MSPQAGPGAAPPLRVAIVGCGAIAEHAHLPAAATVPGIEVVALVDRDRARARALADRWDVPEVGTDPLRPPGDPEAAIVALPHRLHAPVGRELLARGLHLLVEKPLALTAAECDGMIAAARAAQAVLAVGLVRRFLPAMEVARRALAAGVAGPIERFDVREGRVYDWRTRTDAMFRRDAAGGGVLVDTGSYTLDALLAWLGEPVEVVRYADDAAGGVEAEARLELVTASGARGTVELSRLRDLRNTARLHGRDGTLEVPLHGGAVRLDAGGATGELLPAPPAATPGGADGRAAAAHGAAASDGRTDLFALQLADWLAAIRDRRPPTVPAVEARRSVELIERCYAVREELAVPWAPRAAGARAAPAAERAARTASPPAPAEAAPSDPGSAWRGRTVLVTGGTGFLGGRLVEVLSRAGARVRVLVRDLSRAAAIARSDVELLAGDVVDRAAVARATAGCAAIFHCAYGNRGTAEERRAVDVGGAAAVVDAALAAGARVVHVSTLSVYGRTADGDLDEASAYGPCTDGYCASKRAAEEAVLAAHRERGLDVVVVQPTVVYGPGGLAWTVTPLAAVTERRALLVDGGRGLANAVYLDDVVDALLLAASPAAPAGERFLVSAAEPVTWRDFYRAYEGIALPPGARGTISVAAAELRAAARRRHRLAERLRDEGLDLRPAEDTAPALPEHAVDFFAARTRVRIDRARRDLGYRPRFDLASGMERVAAWARWAGVVPGPAGREA